MALVFFPGVIIHELAHTFMAAIFFVPVRHMEFVPKITEYEVKLGSVQIGRCDPIRRLLIGVAPVFVGIILLVGILFLFYTNALGPFHELPKVLQYFFIALLFFIIGNTMFSSKKDVEGSIEFFLIVILLIFLLYLFGIQLPITTLVSFFEQEKVQVIGKNISIVLLFPLAANILIVSFLKAVQRK